MIKHVLVANSGKETAPLVPDLLATQASFCLLNVLKPVGPNSKTKLALSFMPQVHDLQHCSTARPMLMTAVTADSIATNASAIDSSAPVSADAAAGRGSKVGIQKAVYP